MEAVEFKNINQVDLKHFIEVISSGGELPSELEYIRDEYIKFTSILDGETLTNLSELNYDDTTLLALGLGKRDKLLLIPLYLIPLLDGDLSLTSVLGSKVRVRDMNLFTRNGYTMYGIPVMED